MSRVICIAMDMNQRWVLDVVWPDRRWEWAALASRWPATGVDSERKRRIVRFVQRYLFNPPTMLAVRTGRVPGYVLIETIGRRTGKRRCTVVGMHLERSTGWVVAEHGSHASYVRNLTANPTVRVCVRGTWRPRTLSSSRRTIPRQTRRLRSGDPCLHRRRFGTDLLTVRFDFARA